MGHQDRELRAIYSTEKKLFEIEIITNEGTTMVTMDYDDIKTVSTSSPDFKAWYIEYHCDWLPSSSKSSELVIDTDVMAIPRRITALYTLIDVHCSKCTLNGSHDTQVNIFEEYEVRVDDILNTNQRIDDWEITGPAELVYANEDLSVIQIKTNYDGKNNSTPISIKPIINTYTGFTVNLYVTVEGTEKTYLYDTITTTEYESVFYAPVAPENTTFLGWYIDINTFDVVTDTTKETSAKIDDGHICTFKIDRDLVITAMYSEILDTTNDRYTLTITGWENEYDDVFKTWFYHDGKLITDSNHTFGSYEVGSEIKLMFGTGYYTPVGFMEWTGDTEYITSSDGENHHIITITMPNKDIHLHAVLAPKSSYSDFPREVRVLGGLAKEYYTDNQGPTIYVYPNKTTYVLPSETPVPNFVYDHMIVNHRYPDGDVQSEPMPFNSNTGVNVTSMIYQDPDVPAHDIEVYLYRRHVLEFTVYTTNATGPGTVYAGTYPIAGALIDTENERYQFNGWSCHDIDGTDQSTCIKDLNELVTTITLSDRSLYAIANYITYYKLTVINGQDSGTGYYSAGTVVDTVTANDPVNDTQIFDHWDDPVGVVENIYDSTPTIVMKDSIATITAVFISIADITDNSIMSTNEQLTTGTMFREDFNTISGIAAIGTLVFDKDGSVGVIINSNEDQLDDTKDYTVEKLFYGDDVEWLTM